jgi:predicted TIM-barrel fold metal-dependent hydrolase
MQRQQERLQEALKITTDIVSESFIKTQETFEKAIYDQQQALQSKLQETTKLVEELKNLTHIKEGIKDFKEATNRQNGKIEELTKEIRAFAKAKTEGGTIMQEISFPKWLKILTITGSSLLAVTCLAVLFYLLKGLLT